MGLTSVEGIVTGPTGKSQPLKLMVDSGAAYSLIGVQPNVGDKYSPPTALML